LFLNAISNTGGGGGGGTSAQLEVINGGNGGSGIVIIRYRYIRNLLSYKSLTKAT